MISEQFYDYAAAEYFCNVYEFIGKGEGKDLTALDVCHIKTKHRNVEQWYEALSPDMKRRIDDYLVLKYLK